MKLFKSLFVITLFLSPQIYSQDFYDHITNPSCGTGSSVGGYCGYPTYFPMTDDTLKALVIFANYLESDWDPINNNSNLIYMQYWPGSAYDVKPSWTDSVICPTTTNVWHPSLTGHIAQSSNGKFWLIGDVYPNLVITDHEYTYLMFDPDSRNQGACPPQYNTYSYRVTAVDLTEKESCLSERDSISGYIDPCTEPPEGPDNLINENKNPTNSELSQNYPNPFNPVTRFEYSLKDNGNVKITVYDITGKRIATLADEYKLSGNYYVVFNASDYNLSSGVYFYKIETVGFSQVRQMIIIK